MTNEKSRLIVFLKSLNEDQKKLLKFIDDPDAVLGSSDLSDAEKAIVKSGDREKIAAILGDNREGNVVAVTICLVM